MRGLIALYGESTHGRGAAEVYKKFLSSYREGAHCIIRRVITR